MDRVRSIKIESPSTGGTQSDRFYRPANPNQDAPDLRGVFLQNDTSSDTSVYLTRDASHNLIFRDPVIGVEKTLSQLCNPILTASQIANVPSGNLVATNVQSALNEIQGDIDLLFTQPATDTYVADTGGVTVGQALRYGSASDSVTPAKADNFTRAGVLGFAFATASATAAVRVVREGAIVTPIKAGVETWSPGDTIFLSAATAGAVSKTPPSGINTVLIRVGYAKNNTQMTVSIGPKVILAQ
jgi:hypothetical protein